MTRLVDVPVCRSCWDAQAPDRIPTQVVGDSEQKCWYCGDPTTDGIYVSEDTAQESAGS